MTNWRDSRGLLPLAVVLLVRLAVAGDSPPPSGIIRGELLETGGTAAGTLTVRDEQSRVIRCAYDHKTYVEIQKEPGTLGELRTGDRVEVLADRQAGSPACYVRSVRLLPEQSPPERRRLSRRGTASPGSQYLLDSIYPRGNLTFSGVVVRLNPERLVLRTRSADETIFLRNDTRYMESGVAVDSSELHVNRRVFIRAGRNLDQELEAFQVVWGDILKPE